MPRVPLAGVLFCSLAIAGSAAAQTSRCADCHLTRPDVPGLDHMREWDRSPHGRNDIGCEKCHGGNATTVESFLAHRDIIPPGNPKSPLNRRNIPATCGACHVGPFVAFQDSRHYELLQSGDNRGPACTTCHGATDGRVLSPKALESECNTCHGPGEAAPRANRAREVRNLYEGLTAVREQLKLGANLIRRIEDRGRRAELLEIHQQAEVPLIRAINAGHKFVYDDLQSYLMEAQRRAEALLANLANQPRRP